MERRPMGKRFSRMNLPSKSLELAKFMCQCQKTVGKDQMSDQSANCEISLMVHGAVDATSKYQLFLSLPKITIDGQKYTELLKERLHIHMLVKNCDIPIHDGALYHHFTIVTEFSSKRQKKGKLDWPGKRSNSNSMKLRILKRKWPKNKTVQLRQQKICNCRGLDERNNSRVLSEAVTNHSSFKL